ncbi:2-C-methyl-D-erythritol 4-phosphate cytidylyltransferase [Caldicellulosiruptoraceae bacterium PP1]
MITALVVAGGVGKRFGGSTPKQFLYINDLMIIEYSLRLFQECSLIDNILVMLPEGFDDIGEKLLSKYSKLFMYGIGKSERSKTVYEGLKLIDKRCSYVAIHDAARPCLKMNDLINVINAAKEHRAAALGVKVKDTIKMVEQGYITSTIDREKLVSIQTPQVFEYNLIKYAHEKYFNLNLTDDLGYIELLGIKPYFIEGSLTNIKITTPEDLKIASLFITDLNQT